MNINFSDIVPSIPFILQGLKITLQIVVVSLLGGFVLGTLLALCKITKIKWVQFIADFYTSIFRGTPLVLQLMIFYYAVPELTGYEITAFLAAILTFSLNSAAYVSEIIRAGILAIDKGQSEAAIALGVPYSKTMRYIILPQAYKNIFPALVNEMISLTKESAIVTVIGLADIMRRAYIVGSDTYSFLEPLLFVGLIYYILVMVLTIFGKFVERKLNNHD